MNKLYWGDNLDILRKIKDESVDLICTDLPSNSGPDNKDYFSVSSTKNEGFTDIWTWDKTAEDARVDIKERSESCKVYKALNKCLSGYDMLLSDAVTGNKGVMRAYLTFMGPRLVEMHRILTKSGSIYMHCDPNISHYLKVLMDAIWNHSNGQESFKNEIVWYYRRFSSASREYRKMHDIILFYTKTENYVFTTPKPVYENTLFRRDKDKDIIDKKPDRMQDNKEQDKRIRTRIDEAFLRDVWDDIGILSLMVSERLGYPTQKPSLLYTRMIETSSEDGDVVLDPFCGSGTTLDAAQGVKRKWIGIDSSIIALDVTERRLKDKYSLKPSEDYEIVGFPTNFKGVRELANKETNHTILSNWAATRLNLTPSKDADNDTETTLWSLRDKKREDVRIAAEVKVGKLGPEQVHQLQKFIENDTADIVILITLEPVTSEMRKIADKIEKFKYKGLSFPRLQFWQITDKFFDDPESVYDVLQLPGKLRVKPTKKGDRLFPDNLIQTKLSERGYSMAKVKVFLSFEFDRDANLYRNFFQQARRGDSCHDLEDCSLNEAYRPHDDSWKQKARKQIGLSDIVIVVLGDDTHNAPGVEIEMTIKNQLYKPGFQIRPTTRTSSSVRGAGDVVVWDWEEIDAKISECLKK